MKTREEQLHDYYLGFHGRKVAFNPRIWQDLLRRGLAPYEVLEHGKGVKGLPYEEIFSTCIRLAIFVHEMQMTPKQIQAFRNFLDTLDEELHWILIGGINCQHIPYYQNYNDHSKHRAAIEAWSNHNSSLRRIFDRCDRKNEDKFDVEPVAALIC